jgi:hypothetical protein
MSKAFRNAVSKKWPDMIYIERRFVQTPISHVATGFCIERPPSGAYLWRFLFPLYVPSESLHLTFSNRLPRPNGFISLPGQRSAQELADEFLTRIAPHREAVRSLSNLENFKSYLETDSSLKSPFIREGYAMTLVMLGKGDEAMESLQMLSSDPILCRELPDLIGNVDRVIEALSVSVGNARELLTRWEAQARMRIGVSE